MRARNAVLYRENGDNVTGSAAIADHFLGGRIPVGAIGDPSTTPGEHAALVELPLSKSNATISITLLRGYVLHFAGDRVRRVYEYAPFNECGGFCIDAWRRDTAGFDASTGDAAAIVAHSLAALNDGYRSR